MTAGTNSIGPSPTGNFVAYQFGHRKTWTGGDGKFETVDGKRRYKWNNYDVTRTTKQTGLVAWKGTWRETAAHPANNFNVGCPQSADFGSSLSWTNNDQLTLLSRLSEKVRGHSFNMAVAVGEGRKTMDMAVGALGTLARSFSALKRGDLPTAARQLGVLPKGFTSKTLKVDDVASRWLELQYGWKPLLNDVYHASLAFSRASSKPRTDRVSVSYNIAKRTDESSGPYKAYATHSITRSIAYEIQEVLSVQRQLGLTNPSSLIWEMIPYSFCVDWFLPLGSYFDNLAQIPNLTGRFLSTTYDSKVGHELSWVPYPSWPFPVGHSIRPVVNLTESPSVNSKRIRIIREVSSSLTVPRPNIDMSGLTKGVRLFNAVALAKLAFTKNIRGTGLDQDFFIGRSSGERL